MLPILTKIKQLIISSTYITFNRSLNLSKIGFSYLFSLFGVQITSRLQPSFISVEVTNYCNLQCPECPVGIGINPKTGRARFDFNMYKHLIDEHKSTLQHVILYFQGEPLLNKELPQFIEYAHRAKIYTSTSTNCQLLNKKNARDIVLSGLDKLIVSVDGSTQEVYEKYRVGGDLQKALDGIRELVLCKHELNSVTPLIELQFIVLKVNEHQMADMKKLAKSLRVDRLVFKTAQLYDFEQGRDRLTTIKKYARYSLNSDGNYQIKSNLPNHCWRLWSGAVVNAKGDVLPCCFDKSSEFSFGNIANQSLSDNWQTKKASGFRESILKNRRQYEMCRNCTSK